jgi:hypothetical protein
MRWNIWPSRKGCRCRKPLTESGVDGGSPVPALAAMLFHDPDIGHDHAAVDRLAHVVHGQQAHLHTRQRFHLDAGLADGLGDSRH